MNGTLYLVSVGPGFAELVTPMAENALRECDAVVGYELYLRWIQPWLEGKEIHAPALTHERERARLAIELARAGRSVALVSSGDIGVYAMAALAFEEMDEGDRYDVRVIPGITAANGCASLLGSPLSHDFATLSLSDLLCPWEWIEERARRIAEADLCAVFYNVQSQGRQEGVYRILRIMLEHKSEGTICGIVRNAYRPGQAVRVSTLGELLRERFDMFTTLVIGNRFTRRKRDWIYTPRGYNAWNGADAADAMSDLPREAVWVFAGTGDGNALAREIAARGHSVIVSTATQYGGEVALADCAGVKVVSGRRGVEARGEDMRRSAARLIVDITHPYAARISRQLIELGRALDIPYIRFERPRAPEHPGVEYASSPAEAAQRAMALGRKIFLATGSRDLETFLKMEGADAHEWFVRVAPEPESVRHAVNLGVPRARICAMQGPFSRALNETLWRDWTIDCVVSKDSGDAGGYTAKADAAAALGIPMIVIRRPDVEYPRVVQDFASVFQYLEECSAHA